MSTQNQHVNASSRGEDGSETDPFLFAAACYDVQICRPGKLPRGPFATFPTWRGLADSMLRAGLIGFPSSGKTSLLQLLTSAREAPRSGGAKADANVGVARVPDERLDRLTALFNPRKHVPATVEFADIAGAGGARTGAQALLDVAPFRNAHALLHVVRMFRDPTVAHPAGSVEPARDVRAMEDEVILADLGVVERRLERLERDLKKGPSA